MSQFLSMDLAFCRGLGHHFRTTWSDKHPLKVSLLCEDCTIKTGKSAYVAYGDMTKSFGQWRRMKREAPVREELPE